MTFLWGSFVTLNELLQLIDAQHTGPFQIQLKVLEGQVGKLQQQIMELIKSLTGFDLMVSVNWDYSMIKERFWGEGKICWFSEWKNSKIAFLRTVTYKNLTNLNVTSKK